MDTFVIALYHKRLKIETDFANQVTFIYKIYKFTHLFYKPRTV